MTDELDRCLEAGMDGLLTKPLEPLRLREFMDRHGLRSSRDAAIEGARGQPVPAVATALDLPRLRVLVGDDPQFLKELCHTFMASSARVITELRQATAAEERRQLRALAHKLKGGAGSVCAQRVAELCVTLENGAPTSPIGELTSVVEQIAAELSDCASFVAVQFP